MSYINISVSATDEVIQAEDREYLDYAQRPQRIVNLNIGPLTIMCSSYDEAETEATLAKLLVAVTKLHDASWERLAAEESLELKRFTVPA